MADREWTAECVADHFEEAFRTLRKLPPVKAKGYFNVWPEIARTRREIAAMELAVTPAALAFRVGIDGSDSLPIRALENQPDTDQWPSQTHSINSKAPGRLRP